MSDEAIVVTALGMATPVGLDADTACAAARARISRATDLDDFFVFDEEEEAMVPVKGHPVGHYTEGFEDMGRLARLGSLALGDLLRRAGPDAGGPAPTAVVLALPSGYYTAMSDARVLAEGDAASVDHLDPFTAERRGAYATLLPSRILDLCRLSPPRVVEAILEDQAGFAAATARAMALLREGVVDRCLVGGVDSYLEKHTLDALVGLGLLKTPGQPAGTIPGEGAAFLLLERRRGAVPGGRVPLAEIVVASSAMDDTHQLSGVPPSGRALSAVVEQAARGLSAEGRGVGLVIGGLNGNPWTATEWGRARARLPRPVTRAVEWRPAESFGDTGAAAGAIATCLGAQALAKGYARTGEVVAWMSSGRGRKGAVGLRRVIGGAP